MPELFRIETHLLSLVWSPAADRAFPLQPFGTTRILPRSDNFQLIPGTHKAGVPEQLARDVAQTPGPPLYEETSYSILLSSKSDQKVEIRHRDPVVLRDLQPAQDGRVVHGQLNFRSQVGQSRFTVVVGGKVHFDLEVEVFPSKLSYREDYAEMLSDVQDLAAGLALEYLRATYLTRASGPDQTASRLDWLALLRHIIDDLDRALREIQRRPIRGLTRRSEYVRADALRRSDSRLRKAVRTGGGRGGSVRLESGVFVRERLPEHKSKTTLDTPEHQWLARALQQVRRRVATITKEERARRQGRSYPRGQTSSLRDQKALRELEDLEQRIAQLETIEPLSAAKGIPPAGFASLQLQGAPGYREALRALTLLRYGLSISGGPVELSVKDLHLLYEYWCFLGMVQVAARVLETPIPANQLLEVRSDGLHIRLRQGRQQVVKFDLPGARALEVTYNPAFKEAEALLPQQPDIVLTVFDPSWPTIRLVLDAKYRLESDDVFVQRFGTPGPPPDAVNVLHRYRDAILDSGPTIDSVEGSRSNPKRSVIEGAALFPLDATAAEAFDSTPFWSSLHRLGIGALPFLPGSTSWVEEWLRTVLSRSGWAVADAVIPHATEQRRRHWVDESQKVVLVGVLSGGHELQHLNWIREEQLYYTPLRPTQPKQMRVREVALYVPGRIREDGEPGAVLYRAAVRSTTLQPRSSLRTPWAQRKGADETQVVYQLEPVVELADEIVNRDVEGEARRFSTNRWTSGLALARARTISELLMESLEEWELRDELGARGIPFRLAAGNQRGSDSASGRAVFSIGALRIRYLSGGRYELTRAGIARRATLAEALQAASHAV